MEEVQDAAQARQKAAQHMGQELGAAHVDAQHVGALIVSAHGVKAAAQLRPAQKAEQEHDHQQGDDDAHLHIGRNVLAQLVVGSQAGNDDAGILHRQEARVGHPDGFLADDGGHAFGKEHARQGHNKGLDFQAGH